MFAEGSLTNTKWDRWIPTSNMLLVLLILLSVWGSGTARKHHEVRNAPCSNCDMYRVMQRDQPASEELVSGQCNYPCKCSNRETHCKGGVNKIRDGCECCYMCARQQGDLCNYRDKCDEDKGLYCDFTMDDGDLGICRAKAAKPCEVDGLTYKDGEEFKPSCNRLCSCQNGNYACTSLCPQEERMPSRVHCKEPQLVSIVGRCCKEWTCPSSHSLPSKHDEFSLPSEYADGWQDRRRNKACTVESTPWSACSVTCGMGESSRISNDNDLCQQQEQKQLCFIRPCEMDDSDRKGRKCKNTWRQVKDIKFQYNGCTSVKEYRPKYCATCKRSRCCVPEKTKTNAMEWECDGKLVVHDFMWIKSCVCTDDCPESAHHRK